uniref:hypothetical protein n=1 Tax=Enterocloster clostridioformis TaxID=1531 RepID=UPI001C3D2872|nr:hypothetical protein [Enterocloster clostridioformis]
MNKKHLMGIPFTNITGWPMRCFLKTAAQFFGKELLLYVGVGGEMDKVAPTEHIQPIPCRPPGVRFRIYGRFFAPSGIQKVALAFFEAVASDFCSTLPLM